MCFVCSNHGYSIHLRGTLNRCCSKRPMRRCNILLASFFRLLNNSSFLLCIIFDHESSSCHFYKCLAAYKVKILKTSGIPAWHALRQYSGMMFAGLNLVTICNNGSKLVVDGTFSNLKQIYMTIFSDPNWSFTRAADGTHFSYNNAFSGGPLPPFGPQTIGPQTSVNAATYAASGTQTDAITAAADIPTEVGKNYILNFALSIL